MRAASQQKIGARTQRRLPQFATAGPRAIFMRIWKKKVESSLHVSDFFAIFPPFFYILSWRTLMPAMSLDIRHELARPRPGIPLALVPLLSVGMLIYLHTCVRYFCDGIACMIA